MKKVIGVLLIIILPFVSIFAKTVNNCPDSRLEVVGKKLTISQLTAPIEIVKVYDAAYNLVFQCNGDCPESIVLDNLSAGKYHTDIQSYTNNWQFICIKKESILIRDSSTPSCESIGVEVEEDQLILTGLSAPNKIIKVFDVFYHLIDRCNANCGETIIIPNLLSGEYHLDVQMYSQNWEFICEHKSDFMVDMEGESCDNSPCLGNVILETQQEVDEFCACKEIKGDLKIGKIGGSNIHSISNLRSVEKIKGNLFITQTQLEDFEGLGNLGSIGKSLLITENNLLEEFDGLNNLVEIGNKFQLKGHSALEDLEGLDRLTKVKELVFEQNSLEELAELAYISNLQKITIVNHPNLKQLPELFLLENLYGLTLKGNTNLENLDLLNPIKYLEGIVTISGNGSLTDCCGLYHLIDDDPYFGSNNATFSIYNNPLACQTKSAIIDNCQTNTPSCEDITLTKFDNSIRIKGLTAANEIIKVFDKKYKIIFNCFGNCNDPINVDNLEAGLYRVSINFYDQNWNPICETIRPITIEGNNVSNRASVMSSKDFVVTPNPAMTVAFIDVEVLQGEPVELQLLNQFGQAVWNKSIPKVATPIEKIELDGVENGMYYLKIQGLNRKGIAKKIMVARLY